MTSDLTPIDRAKRAAAYRAAEDVEPGMRVGLGTGSTAAWLVRALGERVQKEGLAFSAVATSLTTAKMAKEAGISVTSLEEVPWLDLTIDGADEFDGAYRLIKGGGGALLHEKIVASASDKMIVIADAGKEVETLGAFPLPIEVIRFGWQTTLRHVEEMLENADVLGNRATLRVVKEAPFVTDEGNYILDLHLNRIGDARALSLALAQLPGVVETGLFVDICDQVVLGFGDGRVQIRDQSTGLVTHERSDDDGVDNLFNDLND